MLKVILTAVVLFFFGAIYTALICIPTWILMLLLGALAATTGWAVAIGFVPCFIIVLILSIFL